MPGFLGKIGAALPADFKPEERKHLVVNTIASGNFYLERRTLNKFLSDKIFSENEKYIIVTEGVIFNRIDLEKEYQAGSFFDCVIRMYEQKGEAFFNVFRGSFSGLLYDKKKDIGLIYTGHIGDKQVFYSPLPGGAVFGSEMGFVVEYLKKNNFKVTLDRLGAYLTLTYGFLIENHTLVQEIKKVHAGHYLRIRQNEIEEIKYHEFKNIPNETITETEAIEEIDRLFKNAVRLQFEKDREYGYKHITTLSGGLDSRMTVWVAHELGYVEQLNTTFAQSNSLDEIISKKIATDLRHEYLFKALDGGDCLKNIDNISKITYGGACFFGLAHGKSLYDLVNFDLFGVMHTGQIGDAILGTFFKKPEYTPATIGQGAYSQELLERLSGYQFHYAYPNEEIFCLYSRAFTGANQGLLGFQERTESFSPFYSVEFLEFCYSLPVTWRLNHKIYIDWILKKHPGAAQYIWEKKKAKIKPVINRPETYINIFGRKILANKFHIWFLGFIKRRLGIIRKGKKPKIIEMESKFHMNPLVYWLNTNESLRLFMDDYFKQCVQLVEDPKLKEDCAHLYERCEISAKIQTLSLLSAIRLIKR